MQGRPARAVLAVLSILTLLPAAGGAQSAQRGSMASNASLVVDGTPVPVRSAEGGYATADVLAASAGPDGATKKQLGPLRYEDLVVEVPLGAKPLVDWIAATWQGKAAPKNVTLQVSDFNRKVTSERSLAGAQIVETTIPALDGSSKTPGYLTVRLAPQSVAEQSGSGTASGAPGGKQSPWLTSNFRVRLGNLPTQRVARVESFTVRTGASSSEGGRLTTARGAAATAPRQDRFPNLTLAISEADADEWRSWYDGFVVKGNNGDAAEVGGAIELVSPNMKDVLATITLSNCGIVRLVPAAIGMTGEGIRRFTAELYCEKMTLDGGATM